MSDEDYTELQRRADRVCSLIVASDYPAIDVLIEARKVRDFAEAHFPDRMRLFEQVYEARFGRLWDQFRADGDDDSSSCRPSGGK